MEKQILREMEERIVRSFLDVLILEHLKREPRSGYDIIIFIHKKFNILMSSGTVYSTLYSLERDGSIQCNLAQGKRVYTPTDKGKKTIQVILSEEEKIQQFLAKLLDDTSE